MEQPNFRGDRIAPIADQLHCGHCDQQLPDWLPALVFPTGSFTRPKGTALLCSACWELFCLHEAWLEEQANAAP